jgi:hypothetical protein
MGSVGPVGTGQSHHPGRRAGLRTQVCDQSLYVVAHIPATICGHNQQRAAIFVYPFPDGANDFPISPVFNIARRREVGSIERAERRNSNLATKLVPESVSSPAMNTPAHFKKAFFNFQARVIKKPNTAMSTTRVITPIISNIKISIANFC